MKFNIFLFVDYKMKNYLLISILLFCLIGVVFSQGQNSCISTNSRIERQEYINPEYLQSDNFMIHFTTSEDDYQMINGNLTSLQSSFSFAQSILDLMEISLTKFI